MRAITLVAIGAVMLMAVSCNKDNSSSDLFSENLKATVRHLIYHALPRVLP